MGHLRKSVGGASVCPTGLRWWGGAVLGWASLGSLADAQDLSAVYSDDRNEAALGVFVEVLPERLRWRSDRGPWPFATQRFCMRPFTMDAGKFDHGALRLEEVPEDDQSRLDVVDESGRPIELPAEFSVEDLPEQVLVSAHRVGRSFLVLSWTDGDKPWSVADRVLVRAGKFPGLAGHSLPRYPFFQYPRAIREDGFVETALDPMRHVERTGLPYRCYVVAHRTPEEWAENQKLVDVSGEYESAVVKAGTVQANTLMAWKGGLQGDAGLGFGVPYDVVYDFGLDGRLDPGDLIDGLDDREAGFYVVEDPTQPGPLDTASFVFDDRELFYTEGFDGGTSRAMRSRGLVVYPDPLPPGKLPLVTFSHGNTSNRNSFRGYRYLQELLASYGYITASFDMFPAHVNAGIRWRAWLTNKNTERLILQTELVDEDGNPYPPMANGLLDGKVDPTRLITSGHSRGGEGVIVQYQQVANPDINGIRPPRGTLQGFDRNSFLGIHAIAQVTFLSFGQGSRTGDRNFLMHFGSSDSDVCGCAAGALPTLHYNRAGGNKAVIYMYGAGHGYFNDQWSCFCAGPDIMSRDEVKAVAAGYLLPWVFLVAEDNVPAKDFFTRSPDVFRPLGTDFVDPEHRIVNLYREANRSPKFVIEDFQSNPDPFLSSSGQPVRTDVVGLFEGNFFDTNPAGGYSDAEPDGGFWWQTDGVIFHYLGDTFEYAQTIAPNRRDWSERTHLSFITCQQAGHPRSRAPIGNRAFTVTVRDSLGVESHIRTGPYGGIDTPYTRSNGWGSAFKTYRLRLTDFEANGSGIDLTDIVELRFSFGTKYGSRRGRLGFDDIEVITD